MTSSSGGDEPGADVSERWAAWRRDVDLDDYESRWARMAAAGQVVHGEADLIASLGPGPVLGVGCGTGRVGHRAGPPGSTCSASTSTPT
jgi:hypothetical protein